jgi:large subunit ribosomal protein L35
MAKLKTKKSITKRFKVTRTGKVLRRATGLDHYRAKKSGKKTRESRKRLKLSGSEIKRLKKFL